MTERRYALAPHVSLAVSHSSDSAFAFERDQATRLSAEGIAEFITSLSRLKIATEGLTSSEIAGALGVVETELLPLLEKLVEAKVLCQRTPRISDFALLAAQRTGGQQDAQSIQDRLDASSVRILAPEYNDLSAMRGARLNPGWHSH